MLAYPNSYTGAGAQENLKENLNHDEPVPRHVSLNYV
jgi:hypothetical protein